MNFKLYKLVILFSIQNYVKAQQKIFVYLRNDKMYYIYYKCALRNAQILKIFSFPNIATSNI